MTVAYFSAASGNTHRFVSRLGVPAHRIDAVSDLVIDEPYVLICPTYNGRVPGAVVRFLNNAANRTTLKGVVVGGSRNFGADFAIAGRKISQRCNVPLLHTFELSGLPEDIETVNQEMKELWNTPSTT